MKRLVIATAALFVTSAASADNFQIIGPNGQYTFGSTNRYGGWAIGPHGQYRSWYVQPSYQYPVYRPCYQPYYGNYGSGYGYGQGYSYGAYGW